MFFIRLCLDAGSTHLNSFRRGPQSPFDGREQRAQRVESSGLASYNILQSRPMPTVLRVAGFRFFFYSLEGSEPPHIHVEHDDKVAKFWLDPVGLAESYGFRPHEVNRVRALVIEHRLSFLEAWNAHFAR
jgi:hypothetical protein